MAVWDDLPDELRLQILGYLSDDDDNRITYGAVCHQWQKIMEPFIFEQIAFYITNASILSGSHTPEKLAAIMRGSRLGYLRRLRLVVDVNLGIFTTVSNASLQRMQLGAGFVKMMDGFADVLRDWKEEACFDLQVYDVADCGHHLLEYGSDLFSRDGQRPIECVRSLRSVIHMDAEYQCDNMKWTGWHPGVDVPRVSHLLLFNMSSNMEELSYGCRSPAIRMSLDDIGYDVWPQRLKSLEIWNAWVPWDWRDSSVSVVAPTLERLHYDSLEAGDFFDEFCQGLPHRNMPPLSWPRLKHFSWGRLQLTELPNETLLLMAEAAGGMPLLESLDLWGDPGAIELENHERPPFQAHFQCAIDEQFVTAVLKTTGTVQLDDNVRVAWTEMARRRGRLLHFVVQQVGCFDYVQPFTSLAVRDFFNSHAYIPEASRYDPQTDTHYPDQYLRLRLAENNLEPVQRKHTSPCFRSLCFSDSSDNAWVRYLQKPQGDLRHSKGPASRRSFSLSYFPFMRRMLWDK